MVIFTLYNLVIFLNFVVLEGGEGVVVVVVVVSLFVTR